MSDVKFLNKLREININKLINQQKNNGRRNLSQEEMLYWKDINLFAEEILADDRRGENVIKIAQLLFLVTESITKLIDYPTPKYYTYTDVKLLDWYIGKERNSYVYYKEKIILGIYYLLKDFLRFEAESLVGIERFYQQEMDNIKIPIRIEKLKSVFQTTKEIYFDVFGAELEDNQTLHKENNLEQYVFEKSKICALIDFTCFPRTEYHDEFAFIRTIHISEFCFLGLINTIKESIDNINVNKFENGLKYLDQACLFANILHGIFKVLRTMPSKPKNNFELFRDETGNASAVQSKNYQELDVFLRGIDPNKKEVFMENKHLQYLEKYAHPEFTYNLKSVFSKLNENKHPKLFEKAKELDRKLITWKGLHLGFAYAYLPKETKGTGSTEGAPYLEKFFKASIFDDTIIDYELFKEGFSEEEYPALHKMLNRVDSRIGIAPIK